MCDLSCLQPLKIIIISTGEICTLGGKHESGGDRGWWGRGWMVRMATERVSWRGLICREVGSLSSTFFFFYLSPCLGAKIKCPEVWCWQGAGSGPRALQPPSMVCKENWKVRRYLGRDGATWQDQSPLAPPASRPPQTQPPATPGKRPHPWGGVSDRKVPATGRRAR